MVAAVLLLLIIVFFCRDRAEYALKCGLGRVVGRCVKSLDSILDLFFTIRDRCGIHPRFPTCHLCDEKGVLGGVGTRLLLMLD